jgi:hypothetical protein
VGVVLFEFSPFGLAWGAASLIEFSAVALALGMVVGLDTWLSRRSVLGLIAGTGTAWLAFLVKATTAPAWCLLLVPSAYAAYRARRSWRPIVATLAAGPGVGVLLGLLWTRYGDHVKEDSPLTAPMTSRALQGWNFGTLDQRLDPHSYVKIVGRIGSEMAGPLGVGILIAVAGIVLGARGGGALGRRAGWSAVAVFSPLVFFNLYFVHNYYLCAIYPAVVAAVAVGIDAVAARVPRAGLTVAATAVVLAGSAVMPLGRADVRQWATAPPRPLVNDQIKALTTPDDRIIVTGCDYDPWTLYSTDRHGLMFPLNDPGDYWTRPEARIGDYAFLFNCKPTKEPSFYVPAGTRLEPTSLPNLYRIVT